jgi:hypothetical protein
MLAPIGGYRDDIDTQVEAERARQDMKWGEQNHPDGTGSGYRKGVAYRTRIECDAAAKAGILDWQIILLEEVAEALAESDPAALKTELIQVMAVCKAWVEAIDRRTK